MELIFLDIDFTILRPQWKLAVIDKNEPNKILLRIDPSQLSLMTTYWKKFNLNVNYNGKTFWLSEDLFKKIKNIKKSITLDRIGVSEREWTSEEILNKQRFTIDFILENLKFLRDKDSQIILLSGRESKETHVEFLNVIKKEISEKLKLRVIKEYFLNDIVTSTDTVASRKSKILLEHLIGFKIKNNRFVNITQTKVETITFIDDDLKNIESANDLQNILELILKNTSTELQTIILDRVRNIELYIKTYLSTNNDLKPFIMNSYRLLPPYQIELFESFQRRLV